MTVASQTNKVTYNGDGTTTTFSTAFTFAEDAEVKVTLVDSTTGGETAFTKGTQYTLTGAGTGSAGTVTIVTSPTDYTPASGKKLVIQLAPDFLQQTDLPRGGTVSPADTLEPMHDSRVRQMLRLKDELDRAIKVPIDETSAANLPNVTSRAGKILTFDSSGNPEAGDEIGDYKGNWAASTYYAKRDLVKDTSTNNIFRANTSHTSSGAQPLTTNTDAAKWDKIVDAAAASTSASAAAASATAAASSATSAATSATTATTQATTATTKASEAATSATNAASSETSAASSATTATTKASEASTSATNAASSATSATSSASTATTKASEASTSATNAASSATTATTQASTATTKASEAATSASNAATSATAAASSQTAAASSATSAASSATSAASSLATFQGQYHGAASSDPSTGLDAGDLYFNTTSNELKVYNGSAWQVAAVSASGFLAASSNLSDVASASSSRTNLGAAASGANSDITSLGGLTTDIAVADGGTGASTASAARTNLGVAIGSDVQAFDADILKADTTDELTVGYTSANSDAGTKSSGTFTPDPRTSNFQHAVNGGAHTLAPPAYNSTMVILYKNNASAGTITTSGFTKVDGDDLTTTNGHEFFMYITRYNDGSNTFSALTVKALQ